MISKYIDNPFLIGQKKFDLRLYSLVTSFKPMKAWVYKEGFARFCTENYSLDQNDLDNIQMHLTGISIAKESENYNEENGSKWNVQNLKFYLEMT